MTILKRIRVLGAKVETTAGTAIALSGADAAFNVYDVEINPDISVGETMAQGGFGFRPSPTGGHGGSVSFKLNPYASGSAPGWAETFLPACGLEQTLEEFDSASEDIGSGLHTLTIGVYENGLYKQLRGCMGTFTMSAPTGEMAELTFTFTGIFDDPSDSAILTPTYPTDLPYRSASTGTNFAWGSWNPCLSSFSVDAGNTVVLKPCQNDVSGYSHAIITDRNPTAQFDPESSLVASYDIYGDYKSATERAMSYTLSDSSGSMSIAIPQGQITSVSEGDRDGVQIDTVDIRANAGTAAQLSVNFA